MKLGTCFVCQTDCDKDAYCHDRCALNYSNKNSEYKELNKLLKKLKELIRNQGRTNMISIAELEGLIVRYG